MGTIPGANNTLNLLDDVFSNTCIDVENKLRDGYKITLKWSPKLDQAYFKKSILENSRQTT